MTALLGDKVEVGATGVGEVVDQIEAGQLRALAVSGAERIDGLDAPTLTEAGVDLTFTNWRGVLAPPGISDEDKAVMLDVLTKMHATDGWKEALELHGWGDAFITGADFEKFLHEQDERVSSTLTELGLT